MQYVSLEIYGYDVDGDHRDGHSGSADHGGTGTTKRGFGADSEGSD